MLNQRLLRVGLKGIGIDSYEEIFQGHRILRFEYFYIGLPALAAEEYSMASTPLALALTSLMKCEPGRRVEIAVRVLKRLVELELNDWQRWLLCDCVIAYSRIDEEQRQELKEIMTSEPNKSSFPYVTTWFDEGVETGIKQGREQGRQEGLEQGRLRQASIAERLLTQRIGAIDPETIQRVRELPLENLESLVDAIFDLTEAAALDEWLKKQGLTLTKPQIIRKLQNGAIG